jgi:hypothetical protein
MMNKAIILGCSHATGAEIWSEPNNNIQHPVMQVEYGAKNSYPVLLADALGYESINHAISGGSNDAMFRVLLEQIDGLTDQDIVIACWTGCDRGEVWHEEHQYWIPINYGDGISHARVGNPVLQQGINIGPLIKDRERYERYGREWIMFEGHDHRGRINKIKNILALNKLALDRSISVINIDSFQAVIDFNWHDNIFRPVGNVDFCNFAMDRNFARAPGGHFLRPAHVAYAQYIREHIFW